MKKIILTAVLVAITAIAKAQVPNFGTTVGDQKMYGYSSIKYRASANTWEAYSTLQYGVSNYAQVGIDLYTNGHASYIGYVVRGGYGFCDNFKLGGQLTPSFNMGDNHKFSYLTSALYVNGNITKEGRLFYVTDMWLENDKDKLTSASQWSYLGYICPVGKKGNQSLTPMAGVIHSWKFDKDIDLSLGCYYSYKNVNLYAWTNDILTKHPRFILAVEFSFNNK